MAFKKIPDMVRANLPVDSDLFIVETEAGTKAIPYENFLEPIKNSCNTFIKKTYEEYIALSDEERNSKVYIVTNVPNDERTGNVLNSISINNVHIDPDVDGNVNIMIPSIFSIYVNDVEQSYDMDGRMNITIPITSLSVNGTSVTPDSNHKVNISLPVDASLSTSSSNPVRNSVVATAINNVNNAINSANNAINLAKVKEVTLSQYNALDSATKNANVYLVTGVN